MTKASTLANQYNNTRQSLIFGDDDLLSEMSFSNTAVTHDSSP